MKWLTDLIPGVSTIKFYGYLFAICFILTVVVGFIWHYNSITRNLELERAKNATLQETVTVQTDTIKQAVTTVGNWQKSQQDLTTAISQLNDSNTKAQLYTRRLSELYAKHDLEELSLKKPTDIEIRINRATADSLRLLKCVSGSEDSDCTDKLSTTRKDTATTQSHRDTNVAGPLGGHH